MAKTITTYGSGSQFVTDALMGLGATQQDPNGRFYLDGNMVHVELSRAIADTIYIYDIFRDGQSVTGKYTTTPERNGAVRVMLNTAMPFASRTVSYGGRAGTDGNAGVINMNAPLMPANDEFMVYTNQVNDQMMLFPDLSKEYIPLDVMAKKIADYAQRVSMDRSASTLAEILAYSIWRALNGGENIVTAGTLTEQYAYGDLINRIHAKMDNGDQERGAFTFPTEGRTIIGRPSFINGLLNIKSGVVVLGGDMAQEMLKNYDLDRNLSERGYVGNGYKGHASGFHFQMAPDYIWTLAESYLGLAKGALADVSAIAVSFDATAVATGIDLGVKIVDAPQVRGSLAQPLNIWGHEAFRKSFIITNLDTTNFVTMGFSADTRKRPVAPTIANNMDKIQLPVYNEAGTEIVGYKMVASVPTPNGDNIKSGKSNA